MRIPMAVVLITISNFVDCADDACLAGLVRAIDDLLQPQAYLCSMGADRRLHGDEIMRMTERAREQVNISSKPACSFTPECSIRANAVPG